MDADMRLADGLFLGHVFPAAPPALQLECGIDWTRRVPSLPIHFLAPIAGPDGAAIGFIEFKFLTVQRRQARYAAIRLHAADSSSLPSVPRLSVLSPLPQEGL